MRYLLILFILFSPNAHSITGADTPLILAQIRLSALTYNVPFTILYNMCKVESRFNPKAFNKKDGRSSSYGLFQIKMGTARSFGFIGKAKDLMDIRTNSDLAARILKYHLCKYKGNKCKAISAYNAGRAISGNHAYVLKILNHKHMK